MPGKPIILCLGFVALFFAAEVAGAPAWADEKTCVDCHADAALRAETERGRSLALHVDPAAYKAGVHDSLACAECHATGDFQAVPHAVTAGSAKRCLDCHAGKWPDIEGQFKASHHVSAAPERFSCDHCHDAHAMRFPVADLAPKERVAQGNRACLRCHEDPAAFRAVLGKDQAPSTLEHAWLPRRDKHWTGVRCIVCHTPPNREGFHTVLPKSLATDDCTACHTEDSLLAENRFGAKDRRGELVKPVFFDGAYIFGAARNKPLDRLVLILLGLVVVGIVATPSCAYSPSG